MTNKAYALCVGLNELDPKPYRGWNGKLYCGEADASAMKKIADGQNYEEVILLKTEQATRQAFLDAVEAIRVKLNPGDLFLITFSAHGGLAKDENEDEKSGYDQTWCFYDSELKDDDFNKLLQKFDEGIRILVISDSCHSGSMLRGEEGYSPMFGQTLREKQDTIKASVRLLASSQEGQESREGRKYGLFTLRLLQVWDNGNFEGNYKKFYDEIVLLFDPLEKQMPNHLILGKEDKGFDESKPFTV